MNYRTVWISDLHLGTRHSDADGVLSFLKHNEFETLYLVGDIIDLWQLRRQRYWPQGHNDVVQKILRKARKGAQIIYIPGNHDDFSLNFLGVYGNIRVRTHDVHTTADGQRLLVLHGHEFDAITLHVQWLAMLGDVGYSLLLQANRPLNVARRKLGLHDWSLSAFVKRRVKNAVSFISRFENAVVHYAEKYQADGVVCGHIHTPAIKRIRQIAYYNIGDWVESSTALAEHVDGRIELLRRRQPQMSRVETMELQFPQARAFRSPPQKALAVLEDGESLGHTVTRTDRGQSLRTLHCDDAALSHASYRIEP
jgi:UDP-2,3-diacylglucosamine pyrophosphatase LpxH